MIRRADYAEANAAGTPLAGVYVTVKTDTGDLASIFDDDGNALDNPFRTDLEGMFAYNVADAGAYVEEFRLGPTGRPRVINDIYLGQPTTADFYALQAEIEDDAQQIAAYVGDASQYISAAATLLATVGQAPASGLSISAVNRTALASLGTDRPAVLMEAGREGQFVFDSSNLSAKVTADSAQGIYVPPASDTTGASGAWVRKFTGPFDFAWFGGKDDWNGTTGTDNVPAWNAMISLIAAQNRNNSTTIYPSAPVIGLTGTAYYFSDAIDIKQTLHIRGPGGGSPGGQATRLIFAANKAGFRIQRYNTSGEAGAGTGTTGGDGTIIEGLSIESLGGTPDVFKSAVWMRARATVRDCTIIGFPGAGILVYADTSGTGSAYGNANGWCVDGSIRIQKCKYGGLWVQGGDANAGAAKAVLDIASCGRYGVYSHAFLGNTILAAQTDSCGMYNIVTGLLETSIVTDGTYRYSIINGQEANAFTTPPTAGASNSVWRLEGLGGTHPNVPLYSTYTGSVVPGGGYFGFGSNSRTPWLGCYSEGGQSAPEIRAPDIVIGGLMTQGNLSGAEHIYGSGHGAINQNGWRKLYTNTATSVQSDYSVGRDDEVTCLYLAHSVYATQGLRLTFGLSGFKPGDLWFSYQGANDVWRVTGPTTDEQFGRGVVQPYYFQASKFALGAVGSARIVTYGSAAPTTGPHAAGEIVFNLAPTAGGKVGWVCTTAGTPGTWKAFGVIDA
jgi:hypothetical protein